MTRAAALCTHFVLLWEWYLIVLSATFCVNLAVIEQAAVSQQSAESPARLKKSDRDLPICADTESTEKKDEAVILWDATPTAECKIRIGDEVEDLSSFNVTGYTKTGLDPEKRYNVSVNCKQGNMIRTGDVVFRTGAHYSSSECTSADWLAHDEQDGANVTLCLEPLDGYALLTFNATTPMENCILREAGLGQPAVDTHIHLLPFTSTVHVTTPNSSFSIGCVHPPSEGFQTAQLTYNQDSTETICVTKASDLGTSRGSTPDPAGPSIHKVRAPFSSAHLGIFIVLLISTIAVVVALTFLVVKRIRLQHRRQGQRLLVNEDEAAFRDLQEMDT